MLSSIRTLKNVTILRRSGAHEPAFWLRSRLSKINRRVTSTWLRRSSPRGCYELWPVRDSIRAWLQENHTPATFQTKSGHSLPPTWHSSERTPLSALTTCARSSTGSEVDRENRLRVEVHAPRPASMGGGLPANAAVDKGGRLRGDDPRSARTFAAFEGSGFGAFGRRARLSHAEIHSRERLSGRLRRTQEQEGLQGACGGGHFGTPARPAREPGQRGRPQGGREALRGDPRSDPRERRVGLRRPRLHGREGVRVGRGARHPARGGQARGG